LGNSALKTSTNLSKKTDSSNSGVAGQRLCLAADAVNTVPTLLIKLWQDKKLFIEIARSEESLVDDSTPH